MDPITRKHLDNLHNKDANLRYASFQYIIKTTKQPVDWAYEAWEDLLALTLSKDNHERTIAVQVLSSLAKSDPEIRILKDLDKLIIVTKDEKFVTARHSLQALWKIGAAGTKQRKAIVDALSQRFATCVEEKNCTLIRYDILEVFRKIYDQAPDEKLKTTALALIATEEDPKYKKKYTTLWKNTSKFGQ